MVSLKRETHASQVCNMNITQIGKVIYSKKEKSRKVSCVIPNSLNSASNSIHHRSIWAWSTLQNSPLQLVQVKFSNWPFCDFRAPEDKLSWPAPNVESNP